MCVRIKIGRPAEEEYRILRSPPAGFGVVIASTESCQFCLRVVDSTGKTERLEAGIRVIQNDTVFVIIDPLCDRSG